MKLESPFNFSDYKDFLRAKIAQNKGEKAYQTRLAAQAGCQKSFLSQVLNTHVHLTPDHAAAMASGLGLSESEEIYFVDLVATARAASPALKAMLRKRMKVLKEAQGDPSQRFRWPEVSEKERELYYSSWHWGAIHILVSIARYRTVISLSERLQLPVKVVEDTLNGLEKMKLIKSTKDGWNTTDAFTYLPNSSPMTSVNHLNWRQRALANIQAQDEKSLHYSSAFALSHVDFLELKEMLVGFIETANERISVSPCEQAAAFTCDLFYF